MDTESNNVVSCSAIITCTADRQRQREGGAATVGREIVQRDRQPSLLSRMNHWMLHRIARMPTKLLVICARKQQWRQQQLGIGFRGRGKLKNIAWPCCICQDKQKAGGKAWGFQWFYNSIWRWQSYGILSVNLIDLARRVSEIMVFIWTGDGGTCCVDQEFIHIYFVLF